MEEEKKSLIPIEKIGRFLPAIEKPTYRQPLNTRLMWTGIALIIYLILSHITIYGIEPRSYEQFRFFELVLGSKFGSLMTLGIGPIVTAGILLQLLVGSKIIDWDMSKEEDRAKYQTWNKFLAIILCFVTAAGYVMAGTLGQIKGGLGMFGFVVFQLALGGILVILLDELVSKWGIGSGVSLFIAVGVCSSIIIRAFSPFPDPFDLNVPAGLVWKFFANIFSGNNLKALISILPLIATIAVFLIVVYIQGIRIEIPLTFAALRGFGRVWDLKLLYTSNIPVILTAALLANIQLIGRIGLSPTPEGLNCGFLGCYDQAGRPVSGLVFFLSSPTVLEIQVLMLSIGFFLILGFLISRYLIKGKSLLISINSVALGVIVSLLIFYLFPSLFSFENFTKYLTPLITYTLFMVVCASIFSIFWVNTSGMDAASVAEQLESIGMQIPGYRGDKKSMEKVLNRYIPTLALLGGALVGLLAAFADFTGALGTGTGILLTVMIIYNYYEMLRAENLEEAHPIVRKILGE